MRKSQFNMFYLAIIMITFNLNFNIGCSSDHKKSKEPEIDKESEKHLADYNLWKIENGKFYYQTSPEILVIF